MEAVPNTTACRRGEIAVQGHHPLQNLLLVATFPLTKFRDDLIKVAALNAAVQDLWTAERSGDCFQQPKNLLDRLPTVAFTESALRRLERLFDQRLGLCVERRGLFWDGDRDVYPGGD